jgi:hypothetical protein
MLEMELASYIRVFRQDGVQVHSTFTGFLMNNSEWLEEDLTLSEIAIAMYYKNKLLLLWFSKKIL